MQNDPYYLVYVSIESDRNSLKYYKYNKITAAEHHVFIGVFNTTFFFSAVSALSVIIIFLQTRPVWLISVTNNS